jgi:chemotaxis protein methyltransferase CheR
MMENSSMQTMQLNMPVRAVLSEDLFTRLSEFIYDTCGIKLPSTKKTMLEARLIRRMRSLGLASFQEYYTYLFSPEGEAKELNHMIDAITTNKTDFFREPQHFDYLIHKAIPDLIAATGAGIHRTFMVWSAACSSGEEAYTLAIVFEEFARKRPGFSYMILGTDISTKVLEKAKAAIYNEDRITPVPMELRKKYFLRSKDHQRKEVKAVPELRANVRFRRLNFMNNDFGLREKMDVIFCRNVLIYFDRPTQEKVIAHLCMHLTTGGYLFTGHSETLNGMDVPLEIVANTVSRRI